ncbi:hypothetical protein HN51_056593 [Arachis hypogaea]|uniref:Uncharacterized protein n=1 Tax=Arachis hypogaea TaxID=3818 RepID=A0A6B9VFI7_ARAHY|nr:uncharacterized protein DS421_19g670470 [Arachis hypogaea]
MEAASLIRNKKPNHGAPLNHDFKEPKLEDSGTDREMMKTNVLMPKVSHSYTSLRDIMPVLQKNNRNSNGNTVSWNEIPLKIKNPLVKQAAMYYIKPMYTPYSRISHRGFCHVFFGCFGSLRSLFHALSGSSLCCFCGTSRTQNARRRRRGPPLTSTPPPS